MTETTAEPVAAEVAEEAEDHEALRPEGPAPVEMRDPLVRTELKRAGVWLGLGVMLWLAWTLSQPLLIIFGGIVFAATLDGGTRLLGRVLPIGRGWRLTIVALGFAAFLAWTAWLTSTSLYDQFETLRKVVVAQFEMLRTWAANVGIVVAPGDLRNQVGGSLGQLSGAVGTAASVLTNGLLMLVLGLFVAAEPRLYERGAAWIVPMRAREGLYETLSKMAETMRRLMAGRLLGMAVEGVGVWFLLWIWGIPMAPLLGILTGLLAFIPNIGAIISGALVILVGFSVDTNSGLYAIAVYLVVQILDGYVIVPYVAKRSVDLAPALVLGAQLLLGALFGLLGLMFADTIVAMLKVWMERGADAKQGSIAAPSSVSFSVSHPAPAAPLAAATPVATAAATVRINPPV